MPKQVVGLNSLQKQTGFAPQQMGIFPARARFTILDDKTNPDFFKILGEWSSIGGILFDRVDVPNPGALNTNNFAKPLFPNVKNFPLENELVYVLTLPNSNNQSDVNNISYYYFQPINIWNSIHHNAIPDAVNNSTLPESQQRDYQQTQAGAVRRITDGGTEIELGNTFKERINIKNLQAYEGDIIYEGRWGQSLRFGSTIKNANIPNNWSRTGENGDPILLIRNGQFDNGQDPWIPIIENINQDKSSIYLTSTQAIPIEVASKDYKSFQTQPISPDKFTQEQIILNSSRVVINTKEDSILLSSQKSINFNSIESVTVDSPTTTLNSKEIYLGDKNATESIILGDKFLNDFKTLLVSLVNLGTALTKPTVIAPGAPNPEIPIPASDVVRNANSLLTQLETYKSKISKTK